MSETPEKPKNKRSKIRWTSEKIMSISALFVSVISVVAILYELGLSREENELIRKQQSASVRPHLTIMYNTTSEEFNMTFINKGVGPAFVKKVEYSINDSLKFDRSDFFFNHIQNLVREKEGVSLPISTYSFRQGDVLTANSELDFLTVLGADRRVLFMSYLDSLDWSYNIIYEDIYGAKWRLTAGEDFPIPIEEE